MRKFTAILMAILMIAGLFVSCNNNAPVVDETVSVSFDEAVSRNLTASLEEFEKNNYFWKYTAKKNSSDGSGLSSGATDAQLWIKGGNAPSPKGPGLGSVAGFSQGIWDFKLFAYKLVGSDYKLAYQGEVTGVSLKKGSANTVTVTVSPVAGDTGTLILDNTISLDPAKNGDTPKNLTKVYTVTKLGGTAEIRPTTGTNQWTLDPGAYKVKVDFVKDGYVYASGSVVATVYSNLTTTVSGTLNELVTEAVFDSSINPDVMNKVVSSGDVYYSTLNAADSQPVTLDTTDDDKVKATVPAVAAKAVIESTVGEGKTTGSKVKLTVSVDTTSATSNSIELEIGMSATVTYTDSGTTVVKTKPVSDFGTGNIVTVQVELQKNLQNVKVTHNGNPMSEISGSDSEGYSYDANTGILKIQTSSFSPFGISYDEPVYVATVGNVNYTTLQDAVDAASSEATIVLTNDLVVTETVTIKKDLTIELNGRTINATLSGVSGANSIIDTDNASLTVMDSVGTGKIVSDEYGITASNGGTITIEGGTIEAEYAVLSGNNTTGDMNFYINGGTLTSKKSEAIYMPGQQTLTITDGTINGGISARMGQISISGGEINGMTSNQEADSFDQYWNYSGSAWIGDAIYVWGGTYTSNNTNGKSCNITITGGTINGNAHRAIAVYDIANKYDQTINVIISGDAVVIGDIVEDHTKDQGTKNVETTWTIEGGSFTDLASAIEYVSNDSTIKLADNAVGNGIKVPSGKSFTVDFDGHTYDINGELVGSSGTETNGLQLLKDSSITFKNGKLTSTSSKYQSQILIQNYSNLTLDNMTVEAGLPFDYILSNNNGNVLIKDTTITAAEGKVAFDVCRYSSYVGPEVTVEGNSVINGKVEISSSGAKEGAVHKLNVTGGTFNGLIAKVGDNPNFVGNITGGTFTNNPAAYLNQTKYGIISENGTFTIADKWSTVANTNWYGDGSSTEYTISTAEELAGFADLVSEGKDFNGKTVKLANDIDLAGKLWVPIGMKVTEVGSSQPTATKKSFNGTFDGQNHKISNMRIDQWYATNGKGKTMYGLGLFHDMRGTLKNLTVEDSVVKATDGSLMKGNIFGIVAGYSNGNATYENVHVDNCNLASGDICAFGKVGGILGMAAGTTTFKDCSVTNTTIAGVYNCAPFIGLAQNTVDITGCTTENVVWKAGDTDSKYITINSKADDGSTMVSGTYWKNSETAIYTAWSNYYNDYANVSNSQYIHSVLHNDTQYWYDGYCHNSIEQSSEQ